MIDGDIIIKLTHDQAPVLSDWLNGAIGTERFDSLIDTEPAVWSPSYTTSGVLVGDTPDVFASDYVARLDAARHRLLATLGEVGQRLDTE